MPGMGSVLFNDMFVSGVSGVRFCSVFTGRVFGSRCRCFGGVAFMARVGAGVAVMLHAQVAVVADVAADHRAEQAHQRADRRDRPQRRQVALELMSNHCAGLLNGFTHDLP